MRRKITVVISLFAALPCIARADVGTPLVWAGAFHMILGNALIGLGEGYILARVFKLALRRCLWLLVIANYFSAWLGTFIVDALSSWWTLDIYNALRVSLELIFITYVFTLILEWPFVALAFKGTGRWFSRSIKASLLIQTLSYLVLFGGYWLVSGKTLYTEMAIIPPEQVRLPENVQIFYIADTDGHVHQCSRTHSDTNIFSLGFTNVADSLRLQESKGDTNSWDLVATRGWSHETDEALIVIPGIINGPPKSALVTRQYWLTQQYWGWGTAPQIGSATNSPWHFGWSHWTDLGFWGRNRTTGEHLSVSYGTPVMGWHVWRVIQLPEDKVLFQLGDNQLCILDIATKRVGILARGHGPVAITDNEMSNHALRRDAANAAPR